MPPLQPPNQFLNTQERQEEFEGGGRDELFVVERERFVKGRRASAGQGNDNDWFFNGHVSVVGPAQLVHRPQERRDGTVHGVREQQVQQDLPLQFGGAVPKTKVLRGVPPAIAGRHGRRQQQAGLGRREQRPAQQPH